ncbi:hypothetical protein DV738_g1382, partial [Chaetothyriales sp. CBS 135597]
MKFGQQLRQSLIKDYSWYYIDYDGLKDALKTDFVKGKDGERKPWTNDDESSFIKLLETELDKVYTFQKLKSQEIVSRIKASEQEVQQVLERQAQQSDSDSDPELEDDFELLEADVSDVIADVHDLAKYTQLNYTGFQKIIKKHDKQTGIYLRPTFSTRLKAKPFFADNYDAFIIKLSKLYDLVRTRGNPVKGDSAAGGSQQNFVRQTTKYWVHPDNITELKLIILKHLPVLVFNPNKEFEEKDSAISSIYYDNPDTWELYMGRLKKTEGAEAIRLRWYGGMENETIFVERKTHREDWTGEKSVKARFTLKEKYVNDFLAGRYTVDQAFEKMKKEAKKSPKEIEDLMQLAREIQYRVVTRKLVPVTRSFYHRTAFQLPGDARVRISLDTELAMTREDNLDGRDRSGKNWRRMDIGIDWPFSQLPDADVERFPYAVLEVKLQTAAGQQPPQWIRDLTASHLVEAVPKFSKFIHGTATLFPDRINLLPFWFPQMNVDIRKPLKAAGQALAQHAREQQEEERREANGHAAPGNSLDEEERLASQALGDEEYLYDSDNEDDDAAVDALEEARRSGSWQYYPLWIKRQAHLGGNAIFNALSFIPTRTNIAGDDRDPLAQTNAVIVGKRFKAPPGKRIHVPVRVEPKVYFAAERTFLSWLEFSIIIGSIAAALLNFGDTIAVTAAWGFTIIAILALLYSLVIYVLRVDLIRKRRAKISRYYDKWGTTLLCFGLLAVTLVNFVLRIRAKDLFLKNGSEGLDTEVPANVSSAVDGLFAGEL